MGNTKNTEDNFAKSDGNILELIQELAVQVKETRVDTNMVAKHFKGEIKSLREEILNLSEDLDALEDELANINTNIENTTTKINSTATGEQTQYINALLSDDFSEREKKLLESIEQLMQKKFSEQNKKKKFLGIF